MAESRPYETLLTNAVIYLQWQNGRRDKIGDITLKLEETPEVTIKGLKAMRRLMGRELIRMGLRFLLNFKGGKGAGNDPQ